MSPCPRDISSGHFDLHWSHTAGSFFTWAFALSLAVVDIVTWLTADRIIFELNTSPRSLAMGISLLSHTLKFCDCSVTMTF